jgi:hypothetical protein
MSSDLVVPAQSLQLSSAPHPAASDSLSMSFDQFDI